jgi:putative transposase
MILRAFKYRLNPTSEQKTLIDKHIGACRFVYNLALETKQTAYAGHQVNYSCFDLIKQLPELKKECEWLAVAFTLYASSDNCFFQTIFCLALL